MPFDLEEDQPRLRFQRNPLKSVVWQMQFPPLLLVNDPAFVARFQSAIRSEYPLAEHRGRQFSVSLGDQGATASADPAPWHFRDSPGAWTVALHQDFLALETNDYVRFEDFRARLERLLAVAEETLELTHTQRLGLRYVDHISPPGAKTPADFARYLNQDLIGLVAGPQLSPYVVDAVQFVRLNVSSHEMTLRHGFVGARTGHPEAPFYLIDMDAYQSEGEGRPYERTRCLASAEEFKRYCWNVFRQSIRDELVEHLQPVALNA